MFGLMRKKEHQRMVENLHGTIAQREEERNSANDSLLRTGRVKDDLTKQLEKARKNGSNLSDMLWALSDYSGDLSVRKSSYGVPNPYLYTVSIKPQVTCLGDQYHYYNNELVMRVVAEVGVRGWTMNGDRLEMETHDSLNLTKLRTVIQELNDTLRQLCFEAVKLRQLQKAIAKPKKKED